MKYTAALEALDRKWGRPITFDDWRRLGEKSAASLTDDDLVIIGNFGGEKAAAGARARRDAALRPPDPPPAPGATKAIETPLPATLDEFLQQYGTKTVTYQALSGITDVLIDVLKAHKKRADALEQANKSLESRLLELEAEFGAMKVNV